jgi:archaellum biogenesis ATPase FlaH
MKQQPNELSIKELEKHNLMTYSNVSDFRELYVPVCKERLENNEIVVILPYYETVDSIEQQLENVGVDVKHYKRAGSLFIVDAVQQFFGSGYDFVKFLELLDGGAVNRGKVGIFVIASIDGFFLYEDREKLIEYEKTISKIKLEHTILICAYHEASYASISTDVRQLLRRLHGRIIQ